MSLSPNVLVQYLRGRQGAMLELLERLVLINSHTGNKRGVDAVGAVVGEVAEGLGFTLRREPREQIGDVLVAESPACASGELRALVCGHMDTVFPEDGGFEGFRQLGDRVIGPGVIDMKGGLVTALFALEALRELGHLDEIPVVLVCSPDEERGSLGARTVIEAEARRSAFGLVFECAGSGGEVVTGRKGRTMFELVVHGQPGHAGNHQGAKASALLEVAHQVIALEGLDDPERGTTVNVGVVSGGVEANVIPAQAQASIEGRYITEAAGLKLVEAVMALAARPTVVGTRCEVTVVPERPPLERSHLVTGLFEIAREAGAALGDQLAEEFRGGISDANFIASVGTPVIDGLGPRGGNDHSPDEFLEIPSLLERAALGAMLIHRAHRSLCRRRLTA